MEAFFAEAAANHIAISGSSGLYIRNIEGVKNEQTIMVHACKFATHNIFLNHASLLYTLCNRAT